MTPTATTPSGRTGQGTSGSHRATPGHRAPLRRDATPRVHRRVSGPARGRATSPRQASPRLRAASPGLSASRAPVAARVRVFLRSLPDHAVIDRLVRGRAWILALGVMLTGIVAMQVEQLKLGANIGRSVQRSSTLEVRNQQLQSSVASLADDQRIEKLAAGMGMVMAPPGSVGFLAGSAGAGINTANLHAPSATTFLNGSSTNGSPVTATAIAAANAPVGSTTTGTTQGSTSSAPAATSGSYASPAAGTLAQPQSTSSTAAPAGG